MTQISKRLSLRLICGLILLCAFGALPVRCQESPSPSAKQVPKSSEASESTPVLPAQIELLETRVRFEANGDSRKEVHTRVHIHNELGARQFARLSFDYNRSFQQIEFPLVRITHTGGGTVDILPSAISDQPNPAVVNAPAYQDVRVKSLRILGLAPGDNLEYRVVTSLARGRFAPNFYLSHDLAHDALVSQELFEVDLPASRAVKPWTSQAAQIFDTEKSGEGGNARLVYRWKRPETNSESHDAKEPTPSTKAISDLPIFFVDSDVVLTTFPSWVDVLRALQEPFRTDVMPDPRIKAKAEELARNAATPEDKLRAVYDFVSQKVTTVDLPLGATGFRLRSPATILSSAYAIPEEKCSLLSALTSSIGLETKLAIAVPSTRSQRGPAIPSILTNVLVIARVSTRTFWLDPSVEVAPFGMIASTIRGKPALLLSPTSDVRFFEDVPKNLPFAASQHVSVDASLAPDGTLRAKVHYTLRGENEQLLRVAFHQSPREKWKDVAQLLALSDGFGGKITNVTASDPYATQQPLTVEYEIVQPKFVDWSKTPVRIPALLPLLGLPDPPDKSALAASSTIDLGTPLDVETHLTLHLPEGTAVRTPTGTSVERDYATFASRYQASGGSITASRHLNFLLREISADRAADYNAFVRAVQSDEAQEFTLERARAEPSKQSTSAATAPKKN
ncbi:MAG TPA: DUF3857 domain-containing protein [Candidatus Acidoferrum sp.]|nr:DUF3857 domain-containing protein [Candidatus Acidoferrum sp.]